MPFCFYLDAQDSRQWLAVTEQLLRAAGHETGYVVTPGVISPTPGLSLLLALERRLYHLSGPSPLAPAALPAGQPAGALRIGLSRPLAEGLTLHVGEAPGINALPLALMARAPVALSLRHPDGTIAAQVVPALSDPDSLARGLDTMAHRLATLCLLARAPVPGRALPPPPSPPPAPSLLRFGAAAIARKALARLFTARQRQVHWRIGVRPRGPGTGFGAGAALEGFRWLTDDGTRYYADPFLLEDEGRCWLFMEEFPYASAKGILSLVEIGADGAARGAPRPLIERAGHLSFPFVFRHEGVWHMIAENAAEGHVPLYRARRFPDQWEELGPLLPLPLHDPVLHRDEGRWWLLGNLAVEGGSSCDALFAYEGEGPLGPFRAHAANPLVVDARYARAGGAVLPEGRILQDCTTGYGRFLRQQPFALTPEAGLTLGPAQAWHPPALWPAGGMHTYTRSARFEAIDLLTPPGWSPA